MTMGKDLQHLTCYKPLKIQLLICFPQTSHYEVLVLLEKKKD